jgi:hypothetical protein
MEESTLDVWFDFPAETGNAGLTCDLDQAPVLLLEGECKGEPALPLASPGAATPAGPAFHDALPDPGVNK